MSIEYAALPPCVTGVTRVEQPSQTLKNVVRIVEKAVMNDRGRGRCNRVFDVVRGMVVCRNMGTVARVVKALDTEPRIELVRMKERFFKEPSAGGWRDAMVCFVVKADLNRHVCELQIAHHDLLTARKGLPGHAVYNRARNAAELLDVMREGTTFFDPPWTGTFSSSTWVCALCVCVCVCVCWGIRADAARPRQQLARRSSFRSRRAPPRRNPLRQPSTPVGRTRARTCVTSGTRELARPGMGLSCLDAPAT